MSLTITAPAKHTAAGQYLGYALQPVRLCYHLLTCDDGAAVSIELLDDVAIHTATGNVIREQIKSALTQNPLSDWAVDLWKTIHIWMKSVATGETDITMTRFRYYVTPTKAGAIAEKLSKATTAVEVAAIAYEIKKALGTKKPACLPYLQTFLDATDAQRTAAISRMIIVSTDDDPIEPLRKLFKVSVKPELLDDACRAFIGMAKEEADGLIRRGKPALIRSDNFRQKVRAFIGTINFTANLSSLVPAPPISELEGLLSSKPTFIRQLELIQTSPEENLRAVSDFLRASADKSYWAEKGLILEASLDELDSNLVARQTAIAGEVSDLHGPWHRIRAVVLFIADVFRSVCLWREELFPDILYRDVSIRSPTYGDWGGTPITLLCSIRIHSAWHGLHQGFHSLNSTLYKTRRSELTCSGSSGLAISPMVTSSQSCPQHPPCQQE
jgi:hypothetical protein